MFTILTPSSAKLSKQALQRKAQKNQVVRLFHGAYMDRQEYDALDASEKYRARAEAFLATHPKVVAWGVTAAALRGAPVLANASLHFAAEHDNARSRQTGCVFHKPLSPSSEIANPSAQIILECALSSSLPEVLLAANYLFRVETLQANNGLLAKRTIKETTTEALLWNPAGSPVCQPYIQPASTMTQSILCDPDFLEAYCTARQTEFSSPNAELLWLDFAQLCKIHSPRRGILKALRTGLFFSDLCESPAESLLLARCIELGFEVPILQVNIFDPTSKKHLGRVDGLWPSVAVQEGLCQVDNKHGRFFQSCQIGDNDSVVIEFDGELKYQNDYEHVLENERRRQNAIGNLGFRFIRVNWSDLMHPDQLITILSSAKVPYAAKAHKRQPKVGNSGHFG